MRTDSGVSPDPPRGLAPFPTSKELTKAPLKAKQVRNQPREQVKFCPARYTLMNVGTNAFSMPVALRPLRVNQPRAVLVMTRACFVWMVLGVHMRAVAHATPKSTAVKSYR